MADGIEYACSGISIPRPLLDLAKREAVRRHMSFSGLCCLGLETVINRKAE